MPIDGNRKPAADVSSKWFNETGPGGSRFTALRDGNPATFVGSNILRKRRPNFVFAMSDDEAQNWINGVNFQQLANRGPFKTRMLDHGILFRNCDGNLNACAPTRASCMSGQSAGNNGLNNETNINAYDWTLHWWKDAYGTPTRRLFQTFHCGKMVNGWGNEVGNLPLPGALTNMLPGFDEAYIFYSSAAKTSAADATMTLNSSTVTSASIGFTSGDVGKVITVLGSNKAFLPRQTYILSVTSATTAIMSAAYTGSTVTNQQITMAGGNEQSKSSFAAVEAKFNLDGTLDAPGTPNNHQFVSDYQQGQGNTINDAYASDYHRVKAIDFLSRACFRPDGDPRQGLPFFMTISMIAGHTPYLKPPIYSPDTTNRAARLAIFDTNWIYDLYDTRMAGTDVGCTPSASGFTSTATSTANVTWSATTVQKLTDSGASWTVDQWREARIKIPALNLVGVVIHNDATNLYVGEWLTIGSQDSGFSYALASNPTNGSTVTYTVQLACADIDQTNAGSSSDNTTQLQGGVDGPAADPPTTAVGAFGANPGSLIAQKQKAGREWIAIDDMIDGIMSYQEANFAPGSQYSVENTIYIYHSDNGLINGQKDVWLDKGYPQRANFRVPFVIRWDGGIPAASRGTTVEQNICSWDIYATVMSLLGIPPYLQRRGRVLADGATTNLSATFSSATASFTSEDVGLGVVGSGIPTGAYILSVTDSTHAVLSAPATATASTLTLTLNNRPDGVDLSPGLLGTGSYPSNRAIIFNMARPSAASGRGVRTQFWRYYTTTTPPSVSESGKSFPANGIFHAIRDPLELRNLWGTAEVGAGTGNGHYGGNNSIQNDLVSIGNLYDSMKTSVPPGTTATVSYP